MPYTETRGEEAISIYNKIGRTAMPWQELIMNDLLAYSPNPQTIMCGTPPTPISSGTFFMKFRDNALMGKANNSAWAEWSVDDKKASQDKEY